MTPAKNGLVLALDFGGTKLAAGVVNLQGGELVDSARADTPGQDGAAGVVQAMTALAQSLDGVDKIDCIGVSFGGHVRDNRILRSLHVPGWGDFPLADHLRRVFRVSTVRIANDANAVALAEWIFGAGKGSESLLYLTVSTGIGGGLILNRALVEGATGMAAEIGHTKVMFDGPICTCGARGCLEAVASGPAIARRAAQMRSLPEYRSSALNRESDVTAQMVAQAAAEGDALAVTVLGEAGRTLGFAVANAVNLVDVERVVIGGGVSRAGAAWWQAVQETVQANRMPWRDEIPLVLSDLGGNEGVWGAAALLTYQTMASADSRTQVC